MLKVDCKIKKILITVLCTSSIALNGNTSPQALDWLHAYILHPDGTLAIDEQDAHLVANLLHISYKRSHATLQAQSQALPLLDALWKSWQNIIQTRMNPSWERPCDLLHASIMQELDNYIHMQRAYHDTMETYATVCNVVVKGNSIRSSHLKSGIKELRTNARKIVAQALLDVKHHIATLAACATHTSSSKTMNICLHPFFVTYIPQLAFKSFVEVEKGSTKISNESWRLLYATQKVSAHVWNTIESRRAVFYRDYFNTLFNALKSHKNKKKIFISLLNKQIPLDTIPMTEVL